MKKILIPCDFSKPAISAFRYASGIAEKGKATIHLINVIELPVLHDTVLMPVLSFESALLKELEEKAEKEFRKITEKYQAEGIRVVTKLLFGSPSQKILEYTKKHSIDLVIMGSHGASGLRELVIGSNAEKLIRKSTVPVLIVKSYSKKAVKNIVFPNMLETTRQEKLVSHVKILQDFFKAKLHVVFINTLLNFTADNISHSKLKAFARQHKLKNCTLNIYNHPDEEEGINQFTEKVKGDMIAIGTHGRKGIAHMVFGSLAEDVANHTDKLIWTFSLRK